MTIDVALKYDDSTQPKYIPIPKCDSYKDVSCLGNQTIRFFRLLGLRTNDTDDPRPALNK
jgi:hypothetical protein